jgi:hypothetical protein
MGGRTANVTDAARNPTSPTSGKPSSELWHWASSQAWLLATLVGAVLAVSAVLYLTRGGAGAGGDSVHYLMGADNLLAGQGYARTTGDGGTDLITGFPPFYSTVLAILGFSGLPLADVARWLNSLLLGANLVLMSTLVYRATRVSWLSVLSAGSIVLSAQILELHSWIMTEGLYIFLSLITLLALTEHLVSGRLRTLLVAAVAAALAGLTRYVGLSLVLTGSLAIILLGTAAWRARIAQAILFGSVGMAPMLGWLIRNWSAAGTAVNRDVAFHPIRPELVDQYLSAVTDWILARKILPWRPRVLLAAGIGTLGPVALLVRDLRAKRKGGHLNYLLMIYLLSYFLVLAVNSYFLDAATTASAPERYLAPAFVAAILLLVLSYWRLLADLGKPAVARVPLGIIGLLLLGLHLSQTVSFFTGPGVDLGYVSARTGNPELVQALSEIHRERKLISNNPELVYVLSGRPAYMLPITFDVYSLEQRADLDHQIKATAARLEAGGRLILFGALDPDEQQVLEDLKAERIDSFYGAAIFGYEDSQD